MTIEVTRTGAASGPHSGANGNAHATADLERSTATIGGGTDAASDPHAVANSNAHVGASVRISIAGGSADPPALTALDLATLRTQAKDALVGLGWKPVIARTAVAAAMAALDPEATLERLIFESLRRCPKPYA
jgi:hypothetical protein